MYEFTLITQHIIFVLAIGTGVWCFYKASQSHINEAAGFFTAAPFALLAGMIAAITLYAFSHDNFMRFIVTGIHSIIIMATIAISWRVISEQCKTYQRQINAATRTTLIQEVQFLGYFIAYALTSACSLYVFYTNGVS